MSNIQYESNKDSYDNLKAFIEEQLAVAISLVDQSSERKWKEQLELLNTWIKSEGNSACPIPEATWKMAGILNPSIVESVVDDTSPEDAFADLQSKIMESLNDLSKAESLLRNYENLLAWIRDPNNANEAELHDQEIDSLRKEVKSRRFQKSRELLKSIQATENLNEKSKLIQEVESWNPADKDIAKEVEGLRSELARGLSVEEIRRHLVYLQSARRSDLVQFETSLRALEGRKAVDPGFFSADDEQKIKEARDYFDDLRTKGGQRTSMAATNDLVDTYVVYVDVQREDKEQVPFGGVWRNKGELETELRSLYTSASQRRLQEIISSAKSQASISPTAAIDYVDRQITGRIERLIGKSIEQIDQVPLTLEDKGKLLEYKEVINREQKPKEETAKKELELSSSADSLFARVSHLIKSFSVFPLANVQDQINQFAQAASEERLNTIDLRYEKLESDLERIKEMHLGSIPAALEKIREQLNNFDNMLMQDWFGIPAYDVVFNSERYSVLNLPPRPIGLKDYSLLDHGEKRTDLEKAILNLESAVDTIRQVTTAVEQKIIKNDPPDVTGAIQEFNAIRDRLDLVPYRGFKVLEQLVSQHQGLIEKRNRLKQFMEQHKYRELLDYYYTNIAETKEFLNASQADKSEINTILREAELEAHTLLLNKYFKAKNYKAAQIELNWLRDHKLITERNQDITAKLEKIVEESVALEEFYFQAFEKIGIRKDDLLPTIYSLLPSLLSSLQENSISPSTKEELIGLIDASMTEIDETKVRNKLTSQISRYDFSTVFEFVTKILYCGQYLDKKELDWPILREQSVIETDARCLAPVLKELIKERIQSDLGKNKITVRMLQELLQAYQELNLQGDIDYDASIEENSLSVAYTLQSELEKASQHEQLDLWTLMAKVFPRSSQISSQLKTIQVSYFSETLKKQIHKKHWSEAMTLITDIRSLVTHLDLLDLQFRFFTHIDNKEYFSVTEAETILESIRAFEPDGQYLAEREAELIVADALQRSDFNLLSAIQLLNTPSNLAIQNIKEKRDLLGDKLNREKKQQLQNERKNQDYSAMVLTLSDIYMISSTLGLEIDKSVRDLIDDRTFKTQVPVIAEQLLADSETPDKATLQSSIKMHEKLIPTLSGLLRILSDGYQVDNTAAIHQQLKVENALDKSVFKSDLEQKNALLLKNLDKFREADKLIGELKDIKKWKQALTNSISGKDNAWSVLENEFAPLKDTPFSDLVDIEDLGNGLKNWKDTTQTVSTDFLFLQKENSKDNTQACSGIVQKISKTIADAPIVFDTEFTSLLKDYVDSCMKIGQYGKSTTPYIGLDNISISIKSKQDEIGKLTSDLERQKVVIENVNKIIKVLTKDKIKWKENLLSKSKIDQEYVSKIDIFLDIASVDKIKPAPSEDTNKVDGLQSGSASVNDVTPAPSGDTNIVVDVQNEKWLTKIISVFKKSSDGKNESKLHRDLKTDFNGITIEDQLVKLRDILQNYEKVQYSTQKEHLSAKAKSLSDEITEYNHMALTKKESLLPVIEVAENILADVEKSKLSPDEITAMWHSKQFNKIAMYLIKISPRINFDDYLLKQKNIILSKV